jgi:hypothetical protein
VREGGPREDLNLRRLQHDTGYEIWIGLECDIVYGGKLGKRSWNAGEELWAGEALETTISDLDQIVQGDMRFGMGMR